MHIDTPIDSAIFRPPMMCVGNHTMDGGGTRNARWRTMIRSMRDSHVIHWGFRGCHFGGDVCCVNADSRCVFMKTISEPPVATPIGNRHFDWFYVVLIIKWRSTSFPQLTRGEAGWPGGFNLSFPLKVVSSKVFELPSGPKLDRMLQPRTPFFSFQGNPARSHLGENKLKVPQ